MFFEPQFPPAAIGCQARELPPLIEAFRKVGVQLRQNFPSPPLRTQYASDGDEVAGYSTISS